MMILTLSLIRIFRKENDKALTKLEIKKDQVSEKLLQWYYIVVPYSKPCEPISKYITLVVIENTPIWKENWRQKMGI